ncbi:MAG: TMEM175 family protein [Pseudomonadota bacterium]
MLRETVSQVLDTDPDFEWRGGSVTRIENLSDIVFALALGMLVSASQPPVTADQLTNFLWNIVPVSAAFAIMIMIWNAHFTYFRRYGLADAKAVFLNAVLLLIIMFIAYPLRFIFDSLFAYVLGLFGDGQRSNALGLNEGDAAHVMSIYALGYAVVYLILHRLYAHALKKREMLSLSEKEVILTRQTLGRFLVNILLSVPVFFLARYTELGPWAGFLWCCAWPSAFAIKRLSDHRIKKAMA